MTTNNVLYFSDFSRTEYDIYNTEPADGTFSIFTAQGANTCLIGDRSQFTIWAPTTTILSAYSLLGQVSYSIYDFNYNPISLNNTGASPTVLLTMVANKQYILEFTYLANITGLASLLTLSSSTIPVVANYFSRGIQNLLPSNPQIFAVYDGYGQLTFDFIGYSVSPSVTFNLALLEIATQAGTMNVVSSDNSVFNSYSQPFVTNNAIVVSFTALRSTSFNGSIQINISGVGTPSPNFLQFSVLDSYPVPTLMSKSSRFISRSEVQRAIRGVKENNHNESSMDTYDQKK